MVAKPFAVSVGLAEGKKVRAVVNASNVVILGDLLEGEVKRVVHGLINSEVTLQLRGGGELVSVVTKPYAIGMGLGEGKKVYADIKASDVIIAVD